MVKKIAKFSFITMILFLSGCASGPSSYFRLKSFSDHVHLKTAIIPFTNLTTERQANKKVAYSLITHLLNTNYFDVIEMGETQKAIKDAKVRKEEELSVEHIKKIGQLIDADVLLIGVVEEYKIDSSTMLGEKVFVPEVSVSVRLVSTRDASIIWAANHHRRGDDRVTIFGMGRVDSISELTDIIIKDIVNSLVRAVKSRRSAFSTLKNKALSRKREYTTTLSKPKQKEQVRESAIEKAIKEAAKESKDEKQPEVKTLDIREQIKGVYKEEYEEIEKQYLEYIR